MPGPAPPGGGAGRTRRSARSFRPTPARSRWACRRPVGVVGAIAPWNAALILSARSIAAPLALGNTVVLKPSELSPVVGGLLWGEIFTEAGLPPGVLNIVTHAPGEAGPIGDELVENPHVRRLNFTGSTETGRKLAEAAGRNLKRIVLELGGYNPLIVLADADLEYAVDATTFGAFLHQGQICMSARKIIVERPIADAFVERLAEKTKSAQGGRPEGARHDHRPADHRERARSWSQDRVADAVAKGAKVLAGGEAEGPCFQATLLADVPEDAEFAQLETFGPVAAIEIVDSADEAVARANATSVRPRRPGSSRATPTAASRSPGRSRPGSSTSTTSRSATSRRCRSAASRTAASDGSAARRSSTSSPSSAGSRCRAARIPFPF